jgi:asparagine synthase (glutamine-hydrolysing)
LYWTINNRQFIFSSEIKGILETGIKKEPCRKTLKDFLLNGLIDHSDKTLFKNIYQLEPGNFFKIKSSGEIQKKNYWNLKDNVKQMSESFKNKNKIYLSHKYQSLLDNSLNLQIRSDVELGTTLSSGFDSSMLTYMIKKKINNFSTFTYGFGDEKDEIFYAKKIANLLNLKNFSVKINESEIEKYLNKVIFSQEAPITSIRVLAMHKMYEKIKENKIKVILEGHGGDELGAGYEYYYAPLFLDLLQSSNNYLSSFHKIEKLLKNYKSINSQNKYKRLFDSMMYVFKPGIATQDGVPFVNHDVFHKSFLDLQNDYSVKHELDSFVQSMQLIDIEKVILPRGLRFTDRASMASSIETRVPLLDHRIVEFSLSIPTNLKITNEHTRYFMKSFFTNRNDKNFSKKVLNQKKTIVDPQRDWLRSDKNHFIKDLFNSSELYEKYEIFDKKKLLQEYSNFKKNKKPETSFHIFQYINVITWLKIFFN